MAAFMTGQRHSGISHVVTVHIENVDFLVPLRVGDHALIKSTLQSVGSTSMKILVTVEREDAFTDEISAVGSASLIFVALEKNLKPIVVPELDDESTLNSAKSPSDLNPRPNLAERVVELCFKRSTYRGILRQIASDKP